MCENCENFSKSPKKIRKITRIRLKNIALYYLERFDSSVDNLRQVLYRRINGYVRQDSEFDKKQAEGWVEDILTEFETLGYLNDKRYAEVKVKSYLLSGKPARYIKIKLNQKGLDSQLVENVLETQEYDPQEMALKFAKKKRIGPFRPDEEIRKLNRQKDLAALVRAGFDYDVSLDVLSMENQL